MKKLLVLVSSLVPLAAPTWGQSPATSPPAVVSPEVLADHRVAFRLFAPKATEVTLAGSFWLQEGRTEKMAKDDQGVWSFTTEPLPADYYSYHFTVDGVRIPDPANGRIKPGSVRTQSAFSIAGPESAFLEVAPVPHGEVRIVVYPSAVTGTPRRMHIYFPPGYEAGQARYPVVYLFHGGGDRDDGWTAIGRANFILDNLIAQGKAKPMIVVMPSLWAMEPEVVLGQGRREENRELFRKDLLEGVLPYVEGHYRVLGGPENRALGGLGVGRDFLPNVALATLGTFRYVFHTSGGVDPEWLPLFEKKYPGVLDNPENVKRVKFFVGNGAHDHSKPSATFWVKELRSRGYDATYFESNGIHEWPWFRRYFAEFAQLAFR